MPGLFPGRVAVVKNSRSVKENTIVGQEVHDMIARSMIELTGEKKLKKAWRKFVSPGDRIGLKINPVAGKSLINQPRGGKGNNSTDSRPVG